MNPCGGDVTRNGAKGLWRLKQKGRRSTGADPAPPFQDPRRLSSTYRSFRDSDASLPFLASATSLRQAQTCSDVPKDAQTCPEMLRLAQTCQEVSRDAQTCSASLRHAQTCSVDAHLDDLAADPRRSRSLYRDRRAGSTELVTADPCSSSSRPLPFRSRVGKEPESRKEADPPGGGSRGAASLVTRCLRAVTGQGSPRKIHFPHFNWRNLHYPIPIAFFLNIFFPTQFSICSFEISLLFDIFMHT